MKLYPKTVPNLAAEIVTALVDAGDIDVEDEFREGAQEDFVAIINEYLRKEKEVVEAARQLLPARGWGMSRMGDAKRIAAESRNFPLGDDGIDYIIEQMLEFMMLSGNIEEVFAEDHVMRKRIVDVIRKFAKIHEEVDLEVRSQLRHLQEGTADWDIQYQRVSEQVRRKKGLV